MAESYKQETRRLEWLYGLLGLYNGLVEFYLNYSHH